MLTISTGLRSSTPAQYFKAAHRSNGRPRKYVYLFNRRPDELAGALPKRAATYTIVTAAPRRVKSYVYVLPAM